MRACGELRFAAVSAYDSRFAAPELRIRALRKLRCHRPTAASSGGPNDMWRLRNEICNSAYAFLLSRSVDRCRSDRLLPCVGEPCTRDLRETTGVACARDWLIVDHRATGTNGLCATVHFDPYPDVELRQRQGRELYPICTG